MFRRSLSAPLALLGTALLLGGCGSSGGVTDPPPSATTGSIALAISGLPTDVPPSVTVTGPGGFTTTATSSRTIADLAPGNYTITPARAADRTIGYEAAAAVVTVTAGQSVAAPATYAVRRLTRSTANRTDETTSARAKLLYALPSDGTDRNFDTDGTIHRIISSGQRWLASQTGGRHLRYDAFDGGLDIAFIRLPRTDAAYLAYGAQIRDTLEKDLRAAGFNQSNVLLLAFYDGRHVDRCASAAWPPSLQGSLGAMYLRGAPTAALPCAGNAFAATTVAAPGYWEFVTQHEIFHLLGVVSVWAPNHALSGHVGNDPTDLMYAGSQGWRPSTVDVTKTNYYTASTLGTGVTNFRDSPYVITP